MRNRGLMPEHRLAMELAQLADDLKSGVLDDPQVRAGRVAELRQRADDLERRGTDRRKFEDNQAQTLAEGLALIEQALGEPPDQFLEGVALIEQAFAAPPNER